MISLPALTLQSVPLITPFSRESLGIELSRSGTGNPTSTAWATINQARYIPIWIPEPCTVVKLLAYNGATASGNTDIGLFDARGNAVISIAAAAQAGTSNWQEFNVTDTPIRPGLYYIGLLSSSATATFLATAINLELLRSMGCYSQAVGAGNLPDPATFAAYDAALIPLVGISLRTLI